MNVKEARALWRGAWVVDKQSPAALWSNVEFLDFLNEALSEAARRAHIFVDSTSAITQCPMTAGDMVVRIDPRIIYIRRALPEGKTRPLTPHLARLMDEEVPGWLDSLPSDPIRYITDWETDAICLWPPPKSDGVLRLTVVREPLDLLTDDVDEIPVAPRVARALLHWVSYRAYSKADADGGNEALAAKNLAAFTAEFGESPGVINERWSWEQGYDIGDFQ